MSPRPAERPGRAARVGGSVRRLSCGFPASRWRQLGLEKPGPMPDQFPTIEKLGQEPPELTGAHDGLGAHDIVDGRPECPGESRRKPLASVIAMGDRGVLVAPVDSAKPPPHACSVTPVEERPGNLTRKLVLDDSPGVSRAEDRPGEGSLVQDDLAGLGAAAAAVGDANSDLLGNEAPVERARIQRGTDARLSRRAPSLDAVRPASRLSRVRRKKRCERDDEQRSDPAELRPAGSEEARPIAGNPPLPRETLALRNAGAPEG